MILERESREPLWSQIASCLAREIAEGTYCESSRLPSEAQLAQRFAVNRHTIRRALQVLAQARVVRTERGRGSFTTEEVLDYRIGNRPRFSEWVRSYNRVPLGDVLRLEILPQASAEPGVAEALEIALDAPVIVLERLGTADAVPLSLSRHFFSAKRTPGLLDALSQHGSITSALAAIGVNDYTRQSTRVTARLPDAREARLLRMAPVDPLLSTESLNVCVSVPIEFGISCYPASRAHLIFEN
jgi:GntR family phosphonate transport system transcriptional regulator